MSTTSQPNQPRGRNLIVAFDGTADTYDNDITNIVRLVSLLDKASPEEQLVYYQPGIGTYVDPSFMFSPTMRKIAQLLDQGVAWYLDGHIMGGYQFLMDNYRPGDKIILFGFSRGAYTARCLAGMLHKVGLLPRNNKEQVQFAYECYKDPSEAGETRALGFKKAFSIDVLIEFLGVWDTVAAVGVFYSRHLPFTSSNTIVRVFRHALALDERRAKFQANTWHRDAKDKNATAKDPECGSAIKSENTSSEFWNVIKTFSGKTFTVKATENKKRGSIDECADAHAGLSETDIKEVWFAGCHADVGGGSVSNDTKATLAHPSMRWMVNEILDHTSVKFNQDAVLLQLGIDCKAQSDARRSKFLPTPTGSKFSVTDSRFFTSPAEAKAAAARVPLVGIPASQHNNTDVVQSPVEAANGSTAPTTAVTDSFPISPKTDATHVDADSPSNAKHGQEASTQTVLTVAEERDYEDATAPSYDMLRKKPMWWILELIPMKTAYQDEDGSWHTRVGWNMGRGRNIRQSAPLFHSSVKTRMEAGPQNLQGGAKPYAPLAQFLGPPTYVD